MYICKEKYICKIQAPKVSTIEWPYPVTKCNIKIISKLEGKRSVQYYEASSGDATFESSSTFIWFFLSIRKTMTSVKFTNSKNCRYLENSIQINGERRISYS